MEVTQIFKKGDKHGEEYNRLWNTILNKLVCTVTGAIFLRKMDPNTKIFKQ